MRFTTLNSHMGRMQAQEVLEQCPAVCGPSGQALGVSPTTTLMGVCAGCISALGIGQREEKREFGESSKDKGALAALRVRWGCPRPILVIVAADPAPLSGEAALAAAPGQLAERQPNFQGRVTNWSAGPKPRVTHLQAGPGSLPALPWMPPPTQVALLHAGVENKIPAC